MRWVHWMIRLSGRRVVFIDCGANIGAILEQQIQRDPKREYFAFEANPELLPELQVVARRYPAVSIEIHAQAVWTFDGTVDLFLSRENALGKWNNEGSTLLRGKSPRGEGAGRIDYDHPLTVPCIDLSKWIQTNFTERDLIYLKMDIEGAEYAVLRRMIDEKTLQWVNVAFVEFHYSDDGRISTVDRKTHDHVVACVHKATRLKRWG